MLESSDASNGAANLLVKDKDKYCRIPCDEKLYVVIQLSEEVRHCDWRKIESPAVY